MFSTTLHVNMQMIGKMFSHRLIQTRFCFYRPLIRLGRGTVGMDRSELHIIVPDSRKTLFVLEFYKAKNGLAVSVGHYARKFSFTCVSGPLNAKVQRS